MAQSSDNLRPLYGTLYTWRKLILRVTLATFVLSILGSLLMKNYYQGKTIFYAASQDLFKPEKIFGGSQQDMYYYGSGEDIDRILTVANSNEIIDFLIDSFNLWQSYKIKEGGPKQLYKMRKAFRENYNILLTKQDALELTIEDRNPELAAQMANAARDYIDHLVSAIIKNSQHAIIESYSEAIKQKEAINQSTHDSLIYYREKSGIYDADGQTELLATRVTEVSNAIERDKATLDMFSKMSLGPKLRDTVDVIKARIAGFERELAMLNGTGGTQSNYSLKNFNASKGKVQLLESRYLRQYEQIGYDLEKLKIYSATVGFKVPALHLIEAAEVPLRKHRPKRSVIVIACTMAAFLFTLAAIFVVEGYRQVEWKKD